MVKRLCLIAIFITSLIPSPKAQTLEELEAELAALEQELDSISLFGLIDSLLSRTSNYSELNLGIGYSSEVVTAGRTFGSDQYGINPSVNYYHKSGFFSSYTGYFNSATNPKYYLHALSTGYLGSWKDHWSYSVSLEKSWYADALSTPLNSALGASLSYSKKFASLGLNYSYLFGSESAHQLLPTISVFFRKGKFWIFRSVAIYPTFNLLFANPNIITASFDDFILVDSWLANALNENVRILMQTVPIRSRFGETTFYELLTLRMKTVENNAFNHLSSGFSIPLILNLTDKLSLTLTYSYFSPRKLVLGTIENAAQIKTALANRLPRFAEDINDLPDLIIFDSLEPTGYFGAGVSYSIPFK